MEIRYELLTWAFSVLLAVASAGTCPGNGVCQVRQLGSPDYKTNLLQCSTSNCPKAVFDPSPSAVCIIRYPTSNPSTPNVRIFLSSCSKINVNEAYVINATANVVSSTQLTGSNTLFNDRSCATYCNAIELVMYTSSAGMLIANKDRQIGISRSLNCLQALYVYPNVIPTGACEESGPTGPTGPSGPTGQGPAPKKQCPSRTRQLALLKFTNGQRTLAVGSPVQYSDGSYQLPIVEEHRGERFYIQSYRSQAIGATGNVEQVTAYTLQVARSKKYLVAEELDDATLSITERNCTGLNLKDAWEFPGGYALEPDYRFFVGYNVNAYNRTATFFCPLFHRNYCLFPSESGFLSLVSLYRNRGSLELDPTFNNPTDEVFRDYLLYSRSANYSGGTLLMSLRIL